MKESWKKIAATILALGIVASMTACGEKNATSTTEPTTADSESGVDTAQSGKITFPLDEPIEFTVFVKNDDASLSYTDNWVTNWVEEQTNVKLNFIEAAGEEAETKLNLMMAGGEELPDFFMSTG